MWWIELLENIEARSVSMIIDMRDLKGQYRKEAAAHIMKLEKIQIWIKKRISKNYKRCTK